MRSAERFCRAFFSALFADSRTLVDVQSISQGENAATLRCPFEGSTECAARIIFAAAKKCYSANHIL